MSERMSYFIVLLGAILWGTTGTAQTFIPETVDPFIVATMRLTIGGLALLSLLFFLKKLDLSKVPWIRVVFVAILLATFQYLFFTSVRLTGVAIGTVVSIGSAPIFAGIIDFIFYKITPSRQWVIATFLAIIGTMLLFINKELVVLDPLGVVFSVIAGLLFSIYTFLNKGILEKIDATQAVAVVFTISALLLLPFYSQFSSEGLMTMPGILSILYIGLFTASLGYVLFSIGLKNIPSSSAMTLALAEPFTAAILSVVIVGEYLSMSAWVGVFLLLGGILIMTIGRKT